MYIVKKLLVGSVIGMAVTVSGCSTLPKTGESLEISTAESGPAKAIALDLQADHTSTELQADQSSSMNNVSAGDGSTELFPPNAQLGHCYSRVFIPAVHTISTTKLLVEPESEVSSIIPAEYENSSERVLIKEASTKLVVIPATYKTVTERVEVSPVHVHLEIIPAVFDTVTESVIDKPAHTAWKRGVGFESSALEIKIDNGTGDVMCLVEVPATYRTITKQVLISAERVIQKSDPAIYKMFDKRVVDSEATTQLIVIDAEYKTVPVKRLTSPERQVSKKIEAVYREVSSSDLVSEKKLKWAEVLCEINMTPETVRSLQALLKGSGDYNGKIDGIYGPLTEGAANGYAKSNGLPTGSRLISLETAKHIGLDI
jgi:hypothetical protein